MGEKTEIGVCLFHKKIGEKDLECGVFSPLNGLFYVKIVSLLKGSKLYLPISSTAKLYLSTTSNSSRYILKDLTIEKVRDNIVNDYEKFFVYSLLSKVLTYFGRYDSENSYSLFIKASDAINDGINPYFVFAHTVEKFFVNEGVFGDYEECPYCGRKYSDDEILGYSKEHFCSCCEKDASIVNVLGSSLRKYLDRTQSLSVEDVLKTDIKDVNLYKFVAFECFRLYHLSENYFKETDSLLKSMKKFSWGQM